MSNNVITVHAGANIRLEDVTASYNGFGGIVLQDDSAATARIRRIDIIDPNVYGNDAEPCPGLDAERDRHGPDRGVDRLASPDEEAWRGDHEAPVIAAHGAFAEGNCTTLPSMMTCSPTC